MTVPALQSLISDLERGNREFTTELRIRLSNATRTPLAFFDAPPAEVDPDAVHFRKTATAPAKHTAAALRRYWEAERVSLTLFDATGHHGARLPLAPDTPIANGDIETHAVATRAAMGIAAGAPVKHVMRAMERTGIGVVALTRDGDLHDALDGHSGMSRTNIDTGHAVVGYMPTTAGDRQRLTLAHELGHLVLHTHRHLPVKTRETEAMRFAGAFLLPEPAARQELTDTLSLNGYARIKAKWGISIQALIRRAHDLRIIDRDRYRSLMMQISGRRWRTREPVEVGIEKPALLWTLLTRTYGANLYLPAATALGAAPDFLETWIPPRQSKTRPAVQGETNGAASVTPLRQRSAPESDPQSCNQSKSKGR